MDRDEEDGITSNVVTDTGSEAAPPGDDTPIKRLTIDKAWLHDDDWSTSVLR